MAPNDKVFSAPDDMESLFAEALQSVAKHSRAPSITHTPSTSDEVVVEIHDEPEFDDVAPSAADLLQQEVSSLHVRVGELTHSLTQLRAQLSHRDQEITQLLGRFDELRKHYNARVQDAEQATLREKEARDQLEVRGTEIRKLMERLNVATQAAELIRKRAQRDKEELAKFGLEKQLRAQVVVLDNLERALAHSDASPDAIREGVEITLSQFSTVLRQAGVEKIETNRGDIFDPTHHEAMMKVETTEMPGGHVFEVLQAGYLLHGRLLRAAMVSVSQTPFRVETLPETAPTPQVMEEDHPDEASSAPTTEIAIIEPEEDGPAGV